MKKTLKYVIYCEDSPQRLFLRKVLSNIESFNFEYLDKPSFGFQFKSQSKNTIINTFTNEYNVILDKNLDIDIFFVGIDYDNHSNENFNEYYKDLIKKNEINEKLVFFIPLQCIEYWYYFTKTGVVDSKIETKLKDELKKLIYEIAKSKNVKDKICVEILEKFDFELLKTQSNSFNRFITYLESYISKKF